MHTTIPQLTYIGCLTKPPCVGRLAFHGYIYRPAFEVAHIIGRYGHSLEGRGKLTPHHKKVFTNPQQCRTAALGYHKDKCNNSDCGHEHISFNSCRDRHCQKCNGIRREKWVRLRLGDLLPVKYFHVVFTVPNGLNSLFLYEPVKMNNLLFASAWKTIQEFSCDHKYLGAKTGMIAVLHKQGKIHLGEPFIEGKKYLHPLYKKRWEVYTKLPMHNAGQVVKYSGRYSHRIAISNHRIKAVGNGRVKFSAVDYRTSKTVMIDLDAEEFLRRFSLHILPPGFMKIRHFGILSSRAKAKVLAVQENRSMQPNLPPLENKGHLRRTGTVFTKKTHQYAQNVNPVKCYWSLLCTQAVVAAHRKAAVKTCFLLLLEPVFSVHPKTGYGTAMP